MQTWILSLVSVGLVSLVSLVGIVTISMREAHVRKLAVVLVSFAVGTLLGDAFIHLIPESLAGQTPTLTTSLLVLGGVLLFFVLEKLLRRHRSARPGGAGIPDLATINLVGDALHNFVDGVLIGATYLVSPTLGISTTLAIAAHEIPQELGDFGVLLESGLSVRKAVLLNLASASAAVLGTIVTLVIGATLGTTLSAIVVPVTAGGFIYIAAAVLIPTLQRAHSVRSLLTQVASIGVGVAIMVLLASTGLGPSEHDVPSAAHPETARATSRARPGTSFP